MLDAIVDRREIRAFVIKILSFMVNPEINRAEATQEAHRVGVS